MKQKSDLKSSGEAEGLRPQDVALLRRSFEQIRPQSDIAALVFYRNLFTLAPALRPLFHTSIELQGRKLMESLSFTVASLENPGELFPVLESLGRRHVAYGAKAEHYPIVAEAIVQMLRETLGNAMTPETESAWLKALGIVSEVMQRGARQAEEFSEPCST